MYKFSFENCTSVVRKLWEWLLSDGSLANVTASYKCSKMQLPVPNYHQTVGSHLMSFKYMTIEIDCMHVYLNKEELARGDIPPLVAIQA